MAEEGAWADHAAAACRCSASPLKDRATLSKCRDMRKRGRGWGGGFAGDKWQLGVVGAGGVLHAFRNCTRLSLAPVTQCSHLPWSENRTLSG